MIALAALLLAAPLKVGVVAAGTDARAASDAQFAIELRLGAVSGVKVRGAGDAARLAPPGAAAAEPIDEEARRRAQALLKEATDAYLDGKGAFALDRLGQLAALEDQRSVPAADRVRARLWRAAVFGALKDDAHADAEALSALGLAPDLKVDLTEFPPSVEEIVGRVRSRLRTATVLVSGLPPDAKLWLDERPVTSPIKAAMGTHRLFAAAPGRRSVGRNLEVTGDLSVPFVLPPQLPADVAAAVTNASAGPASAADLAKLRGFARRLDADALIVVDARDGALRAAAIPAGGEALRSAEAFRSAGDAASWAERIVPSLRRAAAGIAPAPAPGAWSLAARGSMLYDARTHAIGGVHPQYSGFGPAVGVDAAKNRWTATLDLARVQYGLNKVHVIFSNGGSADSSGGASTMFRLAGGRRVAGSGDPAGSSLVAELAMRGILHAATPVKDAAANDTGFDPSFTAIAPELGVRGRFALPIAHAGLEGSVGFLPLSLWSESPSGASGTSPSGGAGYAASAGARWERGRFGAGASVRNEQLSAKFKNRAFDGALRTSISIDDAKVVETRTTFGVDAAYRF